MKKQRVTVARAFACIVVACLLSGAPSFVAMLEAQSTVARSVTDKRLARKHFVEFEVQKAQLAPFPRSTCAPISSFSVTSMSGVGTQGGTSVVRGTGFYTTTPLQMTVTIGTSSPVQLTAVAGTITTTSFNVVIPPMTAGTYDVVISGQGCGTQLVRRLLTVVSESTPQTILTSDLIAWYMSSAGLSCSGTCTNGGLITAWADQTTNHYDLSAAGTARPTYNAASSHGFCAPAGACTSPPSITFDGVANTLTVSSVSISPNNTIFLYLIGRGLATQASKAFFSWSGFNLGTDSSNLLRVFYTASLSTTTNPNGINFGAYGSAVGTAANAETLHINYENLNDQTTSGTAAEPSGTGTLAIASLGGSSFANVEVVEAFASRRQATGTELNQLYTYANLKYGIDTALTYTRGTWMADTTGTSFRIAGTGFNSSTAVTIAGQSPTTTVKSSTSVDVTSLSSMSGTSSGTTYACTITNSNSGETLTITNCLTVSTKKRPDTCGGLSLILWSNAGSVTTTGSSTCGTGSAQACVSAWSDLAALGNAPTQSTAADQGGLNPSNSSFSSNPTVTFTGNPVQYSTPSNILFDTGTNSYWVRLLLKQTSNGGTNTDVHQFVDFSRITNSTGKPFLRTNAGSLTSPTWGSSVFNATHSLIFNNQFQATNSCILGINVDYGTELDSSAGTCVNAASNSSKMYVGTESSLLNNFVGDLADIVLFDSNISGTIQTCLHNYDQSLGAP